MSAEQCLGNERVLNLLTLWLGFHETNTTHSKFHFIVLEWAHTSAKLLETHLVALTSFLVSVFFFVRFLLSDKRGFAYMRLVLNNVDNGDFQLFFLFFAD